jgi:hypothetical protein
MFSFFLIRLHNARRVVIALIAAQLLGCIGFGQVSAPPVDAAGSAVRRALWDFDRFLDHHPLLETQLRLNPALTWNTAFLGKQTELGDFLRANPVLVEEVKRHPRYFLYRALIRQAAVPLRYSDVAQLREVFDAQPDLERALVQNPEEIRNPAFLQRHLQLRDFLARHAPLGLEFLPWYGPAEGYRFRGRPYMGSRREPPGPRNREHQ